MKNYYKECSKLCYIVSPIWNVDNVLIIMIVGRDSFVRGTTGLLRKIELFMGCSVGFKYAKNALAAGARPTRPTNPRLLANPSH